jgi:hypothetical protein
MNSTPNKISIIEPANGFTERDANSKAILNTDVNSLLMYKIQKRKISDINKNTNEIDLIRGEINTMKSDLDEIKNLLLKIIKERNQL